jgi:hypothetical protein
MSQRSSGYARRANEDYPTPPWVTAVIAGWLQPRARCVWEPAAGHGALAAALTHVGFRTLATGDDFLKYAALPDPTGPRS